MIVSDKDERRRTTGRWSEANASGDALQQVREAHTVALSSLHGPICAQFSRAWRQKAGDTKLEMEVGRIDSFVWVLNKNTTVVCGKDEIRLDH